MRSLKMAVICIMALAGTAAISPAMAQPGFRANISFNTFYNELSPYGRWVNVPRYGEVWIYSEPGFRPYATNGRWDYNDLGWTWMSDYEWGWGPFHYGRWELDPFYGWIWIPGYDYAPAWVVWSHVDDYYGWAPLGFGLDINISIGRIPRNRWMYAPVNYISYRSIDRYCVPYSRNRRYYGRQQPIVNVYVNNNVRYSRGPEYRGARGYNRDGYYSDRYRSNNGRQYNPQNGTGRRDDRPSQVTGGRPQRNEVQPSTPQQPSSRPPREYNVINKREIRDQRVADQPVRPTDNDRAPQTRMPQYERPARERQQDMQREVPQRQMPQEAERRMPPTRQIERPRADNSSTDSRPRPAPREVDRKVDTRNRVPMHNKAPETRRIR